MPQDTRYMWIGDMHRFDGVKSISANIGNYIGQYNVALELRGFPEEDHSDAISEGDSEYRDTKLAKEIIDDVAVQMMWYAYPDECYNLYYDTDSPEDNL